MSARSRGPLDVATGTGTITAPARGVGASASPPSLHGTSSGAACEPARLDRPLPDAVAARAVAGGGRVEADRARHGPEQRGGGASNRAPRAGGARAIAARRRAARVHRPGELERGERPQLAAGATAARPPPRAPARRSEAASSASASRRPGGAAQGHDQDVGARHRPGILARPWKSPSSKGPRRLPPARPPTASRRGRSSCTRASCRSPARPTSCRSSARRRPCRPTPRSRRTGARCRSPGRSRSSRPACWPRSRRRWRPPASRSSPISTYDTDYVLVRAADLERALEALQRAAGPAADRVRLALRAGDRLLARRPRRRPRARLRHRPGDARRRLPGVHRRSRRAALGDRRSPRWPRRARPSTDVVRTRTLLTPGRRRRGRDGGARRGLRGRPPGLHDARRPRPARPPLDRRGGSRGLQLDPQARTACRKSPPKPGVRISRIALQRRRLVDVEAGAVALLDRRHRGLLAPPRERPDDREAGRDPADLRREDRQHAGAERAQQQRPQAVEDRPRRAAARAASAGARAGQQAARSAPSRLARRPSTMPMTVASAHQPTHT